MVCNSDMDDKARILKLGGPAKVARLLNFGKWGTNRVSNWMVRGIPAAEKVKRPDLFLVEDAPSESASAIAAPRVAESARTTGEAA